MFLQVEARPRHPRLAVASVTALLALAGCGPRGLEHEPAYAERPWPLPSSGSSRTAEVRAPSATADSTPRPEVLSAGNAVRIEAERRYELAELIDIAQRHHPETREAWEAARQAALSIGLAEHTFLPQLSAEVVAGVQHTPLPIPKNVNPNGYFTSNTLEFVPLLSVKWLLFDFGQRSAAVRVAEQRSFIANVAFTGAHEKVVYAVSRDYYALGAARGRVRVAEQAVKNAEVAQDASETRHANGLATVMDVAHARRQTAQARFNLVRATGVEHAAYAALVASMGIEPSMRLDVADSSERPLPAETRGELEAFVDEALAHRTDILAAIGKVRAAEKAVDLARSKYYPKIGVTGQLFQNFGALSTEGSPYYTVHQPGASALVGFEWNLFDGGERSTHLAMARSELAAANAGLDHARDRVEKEVTDAYDALRTSFAEHAAAIAFDEAARTAYDGALDAYRHGVGSYTDLVSAETALSQADSDKVNAHANVFSAAAALAFASGNILGDRPREARGSSRE